VKVYWLLLSVLSFLLFASPAEAGKLLFWRYESSQSRLMFSTDEGVQPRAQMIVNPTRVVIDLPGINLGRPSVKESLSGYVNSLRVGQVDSQTTRIVIELVSGYTIDPEEVKIRGLSPTQWTVDLPTPQRVTDSSPNRPTGVVPIAVVPHPASSAAATTKPQAVSAPVASTKQLSDSSDFRVTRNGLFVRLDSDGDNSKIQIKRSRDRKTIEVALSDATLPNSLTSQSFPVNSYGIDEIQFAQTSSSPPSARITLNVGEDSPDWQAIYSRFGGLVLLPKGGASSFNNRGRVAQTIFNDTESDTQDEETDSNLATIESLSLEEDNTQLQIRADRDIEGTGNWNRLENRYEIRIPNAKLPESFPDLPLDRGSPIYEVKLREEANSTVVISITPSLSVRFGRLENSSDRTLALNLSSNRSSSTTSTIDSTSAPDESASNSSAPIVIPVPPPENNSTPPIDRYPSSSTPVAPRSNTLVIIDPGHGGKDPGAIGIGGLQEKNVVLSISQEVSQILSKQGIRVMMTRNSDYFVSLQGRADMANRSQATVFVSIHANAVGGGRSNVNGLEVYYFGNRSLADSIHQSILRTVNVSDRGVRRARFLVLRKTSMPAALVETGYVTGVQDSVNLRNAAYRSQMAEGIARGIIDYLQNRY
jgi:N-acetylmuramoyl-L-alanine amidase